MNPVLLALTQQHALGLAFVAVVLVCVALSLVLRNRPAGRRGASRARAAGASGDFVEIYVGNLSYDMNDDQLRALFAKYGVVQAARIVTHRPSGKSKGFGFVEMPHRAEAQIAIDKINETEVMGRRIRCNEAREGSPSPR